MNIDDSICQDMQSRFDSCELGLIHFEQPERQEVESHFEDCPNCQKWLSDWGLIKLSTRELPQLDVPQIVVQGVMARLEAQSGATLLVPDWIYPFAGLAVLLLSTAVYAAEDAAELASWCLSFIILIGAHLLLRGRSAPGEAH